MSRVIFRQNLIRLKGTSLILFKHVIRCPLLIQVGFFSIFLFLQNIPVVGFLIHQKTIVIIKIVSELIESSLPKTFGLAHDSFFFTLNKMSRVVSTTLCTQKVNISLVKIPNNPDIPL